MEPEIINVDLRVLRPKEGYSLYHTDDVEFKTPAKAVWLGKEASPDDWVEVEDGAEE